MSINFVRVGRLSARNQTNYFTITIRPRERGVGRDILTTTSLSHNYALVGPGAGVHAFIAGYSPAFGGPVNLESTKPNWAEINGVNYVTYKVSAIRAEGASLITIYYRN